MRITHSRTSSCMNDPKSCISPPLEDLPRGQEIANDTELNIVLPREELLDDTLVMLAVSGTRAHSSHPSFLEEPVVAKDAETPFRRCRPFVLLAFILSLASGFVKNF